MHMHRRALAFLAASCALPAFAQQGAMGRWTTIDDATGKPKSVVEVAPAADGSVSARVVRILDTSNGANPLCVKCSGANKDRPIAGMTIAWGMRQRGDTLRDGSILDPENGKVYSVRMTLVDGGRRLQVRGFLGISLLGRTQVWRREE